MTKAKNPITYVIADDHKIFRQGLKLTLGAEEQLMCIGEAGNGIELLSLLESRVPDVILLDLKMPGMDGLEALKVLRATYPGTKVLMLTMHDDEQFIVLLMEAGANGYLLKNAEPEEISHAISIVVSQEYYFSDLVSTALLKRVVHTSRAPLRQHQPVKLTDREAEVLKLICEECTASEIADRICLSVRTVEGIRSALIEKTGVRNIAGLVIYAIRNGMASA